ncbi:MAG: divalent-cation tolerance protein CutA [Gammaproteobacteria bacterium]|nr:divalent-cation tolerance protein CutA [Gammaproteobacteria bacterium]
MESESAGAQPARESLLVLTTCSVSEADGLAALLVERRLAACVNAVNGITSTYRWQDAVERDQETLLLIKTTRTRYPEVEAAIREHSSYDLPEVLAVPVAGGLPGYLDWLAASVRGAGSPE